MLQIMKRAASTIANAAAGKVRLWFNSADGLPYVKDENGVVSVLGGTASTTVPAAISILGAIGTAIGFFALSDHVHAMPYATRLIPGQMVAADKALSDNFATCQVNILNFAADQQTATIANLITGVTDVSTALTAAIAALPNGGVVYFPPGTYLLGSTFTVATAHITLRGAARYNTTIKTTSTTADILVVNQYYVNVEDFTFAGPGSGQVPTRTAGFAINANGANAAYTKVNRCTFTYQWNCVNVANTLMDVFDAECRYFANSGIVVNHNSDHRITYVTMDNNAGALPVGAGIDVQVTASLVLANLNIIHSNWALNVSPGSGVTVPSIKAVNCFFDTSVVGLRMAGAGFVFRSQFTNCWFSSMSNSGILIAPTTAGGVDGISFVNCDIYTNVAGTTNGVNVTTANAGKWRMVGCNVAGWTNGITLVAGAVHYPSINNCTIGAVSAFAANVTGINVGAGAYKGLVISGNDVVDSTTPLTLGALTITATTAAQHRIVDNSGINPRGTVTTPTLPAAGVAVQNLTGLRVTVTVKYAATASAAVVINGVTTGAPLASQSGSYQLDPGGTISFTTSAPTSWVWVGN